MTKSTLLVPAAYREEIRAGSLRLPVEVRRMAQARRLRLSFRPERGFLLTCPPGTPRSTIAQVLERAEPWALRVMEGEAGTRSASTLPCHVHLPARQESFLIDYTARRSSITADQIRVAAAGSAAAALTLLRRQLRTLADATFAPRVRALAEQHGLVVGDVRCGLQRTRWGSCSAKGGIRLNSVLLFVDPQLADHVLLHELAHTRHMDHSPAFRALLTRLDPGCAANERSLREAWRSLPRWWWQGGSLPEENSGTLALGQG